MADEYIVIGKDGDKRAQEAKDIGSLVIAYKDGSEEEVQYHPTSTNPGQELMQHIDSSYPEAKAVITGQMVGPPNYHKRAIINESEESIEKVVEKYKNGEYDSIIEQQIKGAEEAEETPYKTPARDARGRGRRDPTGTGEKGGRNPECPPEEREEYGRGSGTKEGRAKEGKPKGTAYESKTGYESGKAEEGTEESSESGESSEESSESEGDSGGED